MVILGMSDATGESKVKSREVRVEELLDKSEKTNALEEYNICKLGQSNG